MIGNLKAWVAALSIGKKIALGVVSVGAVGAIAGTPPPPQAPAPAAETAQTTIEVEDAAPVVTTETETKKTSIKCDTKRINDGSLYVGVEQVKASCVNGLKTATYTVTYTDGKETKRTKTAEVISKEPIDKIIAIGTKVKPVPQPVVTPSCDTNYGGGCVPVVSYDLDCGDIGFSVTVTGFDKHRFDADGDGYGCESY